MQKHSLMFSILTLEMLSLPALFAASEEETAQPTPITASANSNISGMSLPLYKSLREKLAVLSESAAQPAIDPSASGEEPVAPSRVGPMVMAQLSEEVREHEMEILRALQSPLSIQRELAARVLSLASDKKSAVVALCSVMDDTDVDVRTAAAFTLGQLADAAAVEALQKGLRDSSEGVRGQAAASLGLLRDERAVTDLMQMLRSEPRPLLRMQAAASLALIKAGVRQADLAELLDIEGDERVKMAIASAIRKVTGTVDTEISEIPEQGDYRKQLTDLSGDMKGVEQKLRDDRHDEVVQVDQKDIDEKLGEMIGELERMQRIKQEQREVSDRKKQAQRRLSMLGQDEKMPSGRGSPKPPPPMSEARFSSARVAGRNEGWASLPAAERDELLQVFRPEVPLRWRKRLEAYFVSLAAEEARQEERK